MPNGVVPDFLVNDIDSGVYKTDVHYQYDKIVRIYDVRTIHSYKINSGDMANSSFWHISLNSIFRI